MLLKNDMTLSDLDLKFVIIFKVEKKIYIYYKGYEFSINTTII